MRILIQGLNKRKRRIRITYYISGFSVKLFSAGFMIHLNKIEMYVKVSKAFNIRPLCHRRGLNPRPPDYEESVLTSCPERYTISHKSGTGTGICHYITPPNPSTALEGFLYGLEPGPPQMLPFRQRY